MNLWGAVASARYPRRNAAGLSFADALVDIERRLLSHEPFALSRFGDGEMKIVAGEHSDLLHKGHGEHRYRPGVAREERQRRLLADAFHYSDPRYLVAIPCPCCVGLARHRAFRCASQQPAERLTWANVFVNANYARFRASTLAAFATRDCTLVCHHEATLAALPFAPKRVIRVGANAWLEDYDRTLDALSDVVERERATDECFLFSAGVLSNLLIHPLAQRYPGNSWLDLGSALDPELGLGATRKYHRGGRKAQRVCRWG